MNADKLAELLRRADADAGPPPQMPADLALRVRRRVQQHGRRRLVFSSAAAAIILAIGLSWPLRDGGVIPRPAQPAEVARVRAEIARLGREADSQLAVIQRTLEWRRRLDRLAEFQQAADRPDPVLRARQQRDTAAFILVDNADHLHRDLGLTPAAVEVYQETIRVFPQTRWADVARQRLAELQSNGGIS